MNLLIFWKHSKSNFYRYCHLLQCLMWQSIWKFLWPSFGFIFYFSIIPLQIYRIFSNFFGNCFENFTGNTLRISSSNLRKSCWKNHRRCYEISSRINNRILKEFSYKFYNVFLNALPQNVSMKMPHQFLKKTSKKLLSEFLDKFLKKPKFSVEIFREILRGFS